MATQCKLYTNVPQSIPPNTWTTIKFDVTLRNDRGMYQGTHDAISPQSALIVPDEDGDFIWSRFVKWDSITIPEGDTRPRDFHERFVRDPYTAPDGTGETDGPDTVGMDLRVVTWPFWGKAGRPIAVEVRHNHHEPAVVVHAQFSATTWDY